MTIEQFLSNVEGYYGPYREPVKPIVLQWLRAQRPSGADLSRLFGDLVKEHTSQYRTPPDVAIMRPMLYQIQSEADHQRLADLTRPQLPDPSEVVDPDDARALISAVMRALSEGRDPRADAVVRDQLQKYGVHQQIVE